ncbi:helix-turn-helix domain-containing protein [Marinicrinis lubricantis]|uniref:Helix-turn-helix domain-containing protein n=1 Tax=Marinicrinis lubricantis TaxID=2086470 RepID=A0ABW1IVP1_9BACL
MYRLLIVDDEEIITDGLYEVFSRLLPDELDVCKAYSAEEALHWMARTRIDIVLTDIAMPGMNGLEMSEEIHAYWPRCKIIFLTGHSEFDYAYKAIQMANVRYLLKTEGYGKVTETVLEVIQDIRRSSCMDRLAERSREQIFELMAQGDYMRQLLQDSHVFCQDTEMLAEDFAQLNIDLDPGCPVVLILGRLSYPEGTVYTERSKILVTARMIWHSYLSDQIRSVGIVDKHGNMLWFLQPCQYAEEKVDGHLFRYLEGTLELIQEACLSELQLTVGFIISGTCCDWVSITKGYERLRQLGQLKIGDGIAMVLRDHCSGFDSSASKDAAMSSHKAEMMAAHLEAGRREEFFKDLEECLGATQIHEGGNIQRATETYYSVALALLSYMNRMGLHDKIEDHGKLTRLDDHATMNEAFQYLRQIAEAIFELKSLYERDRASHVIRRICHYIEEHINEDLSLVKLAEIHYFNPSYLSRFFKQEQGMNLSEYIDKCRIRKAKELLMDGDLKVREVAAAVGYEAAHSFTRFFKKVTGLTPQEYRDSTTLSS